MIGYKKMVRKISFTSATQELSLWPDSWITSANTPRTSERGASAPFSAYVVPIHISVDTITDIEIILNNEDRGTKYNIFDDSFQRRCLAIPLSVNQPIACRIPDFTATPSVLTCDLYVEIYYQSDLSADQIRRLLCSMGIA